MQSEQIHPPEPGQPKSFTQVISIIVGFVLFIIGLCGILFPAFAGLHLSIIHSVLIASAGVILFYYGGWLDDSFYAYYVCLGFGIFFGLLSAIGFTFGQPGMPTVGYLRMDSFLLRIIPGVQELGRTDHILNGVISLILLGGAIDWSRRHFQRNTVRDDIRRYRSQRRNSKLVHP